MSTNINWPRSSASVRKGRAYGPRRPAQKLLVPLIGADRAAVDDDKARLMARVRSLVLRRLARFDAADGFANAGADCHAHDERQHEEEQKHQLEDEAEHQNNPRLTPTPASLRRRR